MTAVTKYSLSIHGFSPGKTLRATVFALDDAGRGAQISFYDNDATIPTDSQTADRIAIHLPVALLANVVDLLRNEKPIVVDFIGGRGHIGTAADQEPIGEGE